MNADHGAEAREKNCFVLEREVLRVFEEESSKRRGMRQLHGRRKAAGCWNWLSWTPPEKPFSRHLWNHKILCVGSFLEEVCKRSHCGGRIIWGKNSYPRRDTRPSGVGSLPHWELRIRIPALNFKCTHLTACSNISTGVRKSTLNVKSPSLKSLPPPYPLSQEIFHHSTVSYDLFTSVVTFCLKPYHGSA